MQTRLWFTTKAGMAAFLLVAPAEAQTPAAGFTDLKDHLRLDVGGFQIAADTQLQYSLGGPGEVIDFERDTALPGGSTTFWLDGTWRLSRRHQLSLNFTRSSRSSDRTTLSREISWGDQVFEVGASVESKASTDILAGYYRFALVRSDRFEVGPAVGVGYLWLSATLRASATAGGATGSVSRTGTVGSITGDLGGYFAAWPARRVQLRGDLLYILVKPENAEASVTDGRLGLYWYPWTKVGFGGQYKYYKYRYERTVLSTDLGGNITYQGGQAFVSFLF